MVCAHPVVPTSTASARGCTGEWRPGTGAVIGPHMGWGRVVDLLVSHAPTYALYTHPAAALS